MAAERPAGPPPTMATSNCTGDMACRDGQERNRGRHTAENDAAENPRAEHEKAENEQADVVRPSVLRLAVLRRLVLRRSVLRPFVPIAPGPRGRSTAAAPSPCRRARGPARGRAAP